MGWLLAGLTGPAWASGDPIIVYSFAGQILALVAGLIWIVVAKVSLRSKTIAFVVWSAALCSLLVLANVPDYGGHRLWIGAGQGLVLIAAATAMHPFLRRR